MSADKNIEKLFENARHSELIISLEQIEENIKVKGFRTPKKHKLVNLKTTIIMSTLLSLLVGLFFIVPQTSKDAKTPIKSITKQNKKTECSIFKEPISNQKQSKSIDKSEKFKLPNLDVAMMNNPRMSELPKYFKNEAKGSLPTDSGKVQKNEISEDSKPIDRSIDMKNIHLIELTNDELQKLGVNVIDKSIQVTTVSKYNMKPFVTNYSKSGTTFNIDLKRFSQPRGNENKEGMQIELYQNKNDLSSKNRIPSNLSNINIDVISGPEHPPLSYSKITNISTKINDSSNTYPDFSLITDDLGQLWRLYKVEDGLTDEDRLYMHEHRLNPDMYPKAIEGRARGEKELITKLGGYIPILVKSGDVNLESDKAKKLWRADIIIWFEPSELLFSLLPERISKDLKSEYQSIFVKKEGNGSSCKYFEACKNMPGAIESFIIYPNPTDDKFEMEFSLNNSRILSAGLYSVNGQLLKTILSNKTFEKGSSSYATSIAELPQGVYLLVVESDKGDVITKRIIRK